MPEIHLPERSAPMQEIISRVPSRIIRWGMTLVFAFFVLLLFLSWFIRYPEVTTGPVLVSTEKTTQENLHSPFVVSMQVPKAGYAKIREGQTVWMTLDNYPVHEFGQVEGKVSQIATRAQGDTYRVEIQLINGLHSSYGHTLTYTPDLTGTGKIITADVKLLHRILGPLRMIRS